MLHNLKGWCLTKKKHSVSVVPEGTLLFFFLLRRRNSEVKSYKSNNQQQATQPQQKRKPSHHHHTDAAMTSETCYKQLYYSKRIPLGRSQCIRALLFNSLLHPSCASVIQVANCKFSVLFCRVPASFSSISMKYAQSVPICSKKKSLLRFTLNSASHTQSLLEAQVSDSVIHTPTEGNDAYKESENVTL
jgi:hypothetical protein